MSCKSCKQVFEEFWVPPCGCKMCPACYKQKYQDHWGIRAAAWNHLEWDTSARSGPWRCPFCKSEIGEFGNFQIDLSGSPNLDAQRIRDHGHPIEKRRRAKKDKNNEKRMERRRKQLKKKQDAYLASLRGSSSSQGARSSVTEASSNAGGASR